MGFQHLGRYLYTFGLFRRLLGPSNRVGSMEKWWSHFQPDHICICSQLHSECRLASTVPIQHTLGLHLGNDLYRWYFGHQPVHSGSCRQSSHELDWSHYCESSIQRIFRLGHSGHDLEHELHAEIMGYVRPSYRCGTKESKGSYFHVVHDVHHRGELVHRH